VKWIGRGDNASQSAGPPGPEVRSHQFGARGGTWRPPPPRAAAVTTLSPAAPEAYAGPALPAPIVLPPAFRERIDLVSTDISATHDIAGFIGACLVDSDSGLMLASEGGGRLDMEAAAALNTQVVKAKMQAIDVLGLDDVIEDILITMGKQLHFIRPLEKAPSVFLYVALDKKAANLGMARMQVKRIESGLSL